MSAAEEVGVLQEIVVRNAVDAEGMPAGGTVDLQSSSFFADGGLKIRWQDGPLGRGDDRRAPNGAFVETVIAAAKSRLEFYQTVCAGRFACQANADAIEHLAEALLVLDARTQEREARAVEGTHTA